MRGTPYEPAQSPPEPPVLTIITAIGFVALAAYNAKQGNAIAALLSLGVACAPIINLILWLRKFKGKP